jgi:nucleoside-diphosphate-sugar epimerase
MRILITGHNGYIGSVLTPLVRSAGHDVTGLDTYYYEDCTLGIEGAAVHAIRKDLRDLSERDLQGFDAVIHLAGLSNDPLGDLDPQWTFALNHLASVHLARLAREAGVQRFVYASSCSMYGAASMDDLLTEEAPLNPLTPYAVSKVRTEEDLSKLADEHFSPIFMRNATAYGFSPHLRADVVLNNLVCWAFTTGKIRIMSDGTPWRPIVHIADIAGASLALLDAPRQIVHNQAFNIGVNGENYQVRDLAKIVQETVPGCVIEYAGQTGPDPRNYRVDFTKLARMVPAFKSRWNAYEGAKELYEAFRQAGLTFEEFQGRKFTRLKQLKYLIETDQLDKTLRWKNIKSN